MWMWAAAALGVLAIQHQQQPPAAASGSVQNGGGTMIVNPADAIAAASSPPVGTAPAINPFMLMGVAPGGPGSGANRPIYSGAAPVTTCPCKQPNFLSPGVPTALLPIKLM